MTRLDDLAEQATAHYDAMRAFRTLVHDGAGAIPAPAAYQALGNLKNSMGGMMAEALTDLGARLEESLAEYDVYDLMGSPAGSITVATVRLNQAAELATRIGVLLEQAQIAINSQGYNTPSDMGDDAA